MECKEAVFWKAASLLRYQVIFMRGGIRASIILEMDRRLRFGWVVLLLGLLSCQAQLPARPPQATQAALLARHTTPAVARPPDAAPKTLPVEAPSGPPAETPGPATYAPGQAAWAPSPTAPPPRPTATAAPPPFQLCSPLEGIERADLPRLISDGYTAPLPGSDARHEGIDLAYYNFKGHRMIDGTQVTALMDGRVAAALNGTFPYGSFVIIETPNERLPEDLKTLLKLPAGDSLYYLYAHLQDQSPTVNLDQPVRACQVLGVVGKTGNTAAAHLHLEIRLGPPGARFEGMSYFTDTATPSEKANYRLWRISWTYQHFDPLRLLGYQLIPWPTPVIR